MDGGRDRDGGSEAGKKGGSETESIGMSGYNLIRQLIIYIINY